MRKDLLRVAIQVIVYVVLYFFTALVFGPLLLWLGGYLAGNTGAVLLSAIAANWLTLRIYEGRPIADLGLWWNPASRANLGWGLLGGMGSACLVLLPPLAVHAAHLSRLSGEPGSAGTIAFVILLLAVGSMGEELFFRGFAFQRILATLGPFATIIPVGLIFALMHGANPNASRLGIANTAGFGILFGWAYFRTRDLWLPIGLHFGWNLVLPLLGVNLSGLKINITGYQMTWTAGDLWSGGGYGPEASLLTSAVLAVLAAYLYKIPVRRQESPLTDRPPKPLEGPEALAPPPRLPPV